VRPAGNYDTFMKTVAENEIVQMKKYQKEQEDIKHIKEFIASCGEWRRIAAACIVLQSNCTQALGLYVTNSGSHSQSNIAIQLAVRQALLWLVARWWLAG
jgi:ATPase subunit of ABC transporter with duplicated ATPase domains